MVAVSTTVEFALT